MVMVEVSKLLAVVAAAYSRFEVNEIKQQLWFEMLKDIPYEAAQVSLKKHICESPYPPSIADIRRGASNLSAPQGNNPEVGEAWGEVQKAISSYGMYNPEKAYKSMSPLTAMAAKSMGWREMCTSQEPSVIRGQFMKIYESLKQREEKYRLIPEELRKGIEEIAKRKKLLDLIP